MPDRRPRTWDIALAVIAAAALALEGQLQAKTALSPGGYVLAAAAAAPLAWRTRTPLAALAGVEAGAVVCAVALDAAWAATAMVVVELYTVALLGDRQRSLVVGAVTAVPVVVTIVLIEGSVELTGVAARLSLVFASLALGDTIRGRRALRAEARARAQREAREREADHKRRVADERVRIARELHDTLAHSLVAINVRASVAVDLQGSQDPSAALKDIKQASATALRELRATLSLLREEDDHAPTAPAFDLQALPGLVRQARSAGLSAEVDVDVDGAAVPSAIGGAAFRIVQEALTNVLRHADASSARVTVRATDDSLDVEITDDGHADNASAPTGLGLRGMLERATALGGRLDAGPRKDGGWRVHAVLPLDRGRGR
jgi:signal transduction histidine kinase